MKLVIITQHQENYGDPDRPYWKFKGGDTYIVENLTEEQAQRALDTGMPVLTKLINRDGEMFKEYVREIMAVPDDAVVTEEWEDPIVLEHKDGLGWTARQIQHSNGCFRKGIKSKNVSWVLGFENYVVTFDMEDGRTGLSYKELEAEFA